MLSTRERDVLAVIAEHDGQWYWYQVDRALSGRGASGPFMVEIQALIAAGLIEERSISGEAIARYWVTAAGHAALAGFSGESI